VVARPTADGEGRRLVAYVVAAADAPGAELERELAEALRSRLPEYLVPQGFVFLPALPLTANGKVDRDALPDPGAAVVETPYVAPSSVAEELIAELCRDLLGVERVGLDDDLFVLGAHSLTATRLAARLGDAFQLDFPLRRLFEAPTVAGVLAEIAGLAGGREAVEQIAALYREVEGLSDDDVRSRLA
jgi:acyl carrier protein